MYLDINKDDCLSAIKRICCPFLPIEFSTVIFNGALKESINNGTDEYAQRSGWTMELIAAC
jgi:hypothetical protein